MEIIIFVCQIKNTRIMKKYSYYEVAVSTDAGTNSPSMEYEDYRSAFGQYQHFKKSGAEHATLWGVDEMGDYTCIMSF